MRLLAVLLIAGSSLVAQRGQYSPSPTGFGRLSNPSAVRPTTGGAGFGRVIYPGTGGPPAAVRPGTGIGVRPSAPPPVAHSHVRSVIVPYPVFYGGYYYGYDAPPAAGYAPAGGYDSGYAYDQNAGGQEQSPVVIINQNFRPDTLNPVVRDYSNTPLPQAANNPAQGPDQATINDGSQVVFLIAMTDHTIFPAIAYWVEGDTLNYITTQGVHNRATLDLVDRDFSKQLNDQRHVDFALPPAK